MNEKYCRLTIIENNIPYKTKGGTPLKKCRCKCECGNETIVLYQNLRRGITRSCGCLRNELRIKNKTTHGLGRTRQYGIWNQMIMRCNNVNSISYRNYGAKGIKVCNKWLKFEGFWEDMEDGYKDNLTIDRINNKKGYSKENCKWSTWKEQNNNRTNNRILTLNGKSQTLMQWSEQLGIHRGSIQSRLMRGWTVKKALTTPINTVFNPKNK